MDAHYPTAEEPASPEYVLAVERDLHRQQCQFDPEADPEVVLTRDTTVAEWREACDLLPWWQLGRALNTFWNIQASDAEWEAVLEPARKKRLSDVCEFIARRASRARIRAPFLFGRRCAAAGAFLTIRSLLHEAGANAGDIRPSTPLGAYARRYGEVLLAANSRLAPGALPPVRVAVPAEDRAMRWFLIGVHVLLAGCCVGSPLVGAAGSAVMLLACAWASISARCLLPSSVEFGSLRTFRDLAVVLSSSVQL
jgi:hypothetical protein